MVWDKLISLLLTYHVREKYWVIIAIIAHRFWCAWSPVFLLLVAVSVYML